MSRISLGCFRIGTSLESCKPGNNGGHWVNVNEEEKQYSSVVWYTLYLLFVVQNETGILNFQRASFTAVHRASLNWLHWVQLAGGIPHWSQPHMFRRDWERPSRGSWVCRLHTAPLLEECGSPATPHPASTVTPEVAPWFLKEKEPQKHMRR